jgi:hypothetical protein
VTTVNLRLRGCRTAPEVAVPFAELCRAAGNLLYAADAEAADDIRLSRDLDTEPATLLGGEAGVMLSLGIPRVTGDPGPRPHRKFKADAKGNKRGQVFVQVHSANAHIGAMGTMAMFEHIARTEDYEATTRPMGGAILRILEIADGGGWLPVPSFDETTLLYAISDQVALADDPRHFHDEVDKRQG